MVVFVFGVAPSPPAPPQAPAPVWLPFGQTWTGWNGDVFDLTGADAAGLSLEPGVRGLTMPPYQKFGSSSQYVDGAAHRGSRATERGVFWPARVYSSAGSQAWVEFDRRFWKTMDPDRAGTWTVTEPSGQSSRTLRCRYDDDGSHSFDIDPALMGHAVYGITLSADDSMWEGPEVVAPFPFDAPQDFIPVGGGPPFYISGGSSLASATVVNPGDVPAWQTWWVGEGETSSVLGVGGKNVIVPFAVAAGRLLVVDSHPRARTAKDIPAPPLVDGNPQPQAAQAAWVAAQLPTAVDKTGLLDSASRWGAITPGNPTPITLSMVGTANIRCSFIPRYRRAW